MSMIKHLMEVHGSIEPELIDTVYDHIKARLKHGAPLDIEHAIGDYIERDGANLSKEQMRGLVSVIRNKLNAERMRLSAAVQK